MNSPLPTIELATLEKAGYQLLSAGKLQDALRTFRQVLERYPNEVAGHIGLASTFGRMWHWRAALAEWEICIDVGSAELSQLARVQAGRVLVEMGELDEARTRLAPVSDCLEALEVLAEIAELCAPPAVAAAAWEQCAQADPTRPVGWLGKARLLLGRECFEEAEQLLLHVSRQWPDCISARVLAASAATAAKNWVTAGQRWEQLLPWSSDHGEIRTGYIRYLAALDRRVTLIRYLAQLADKPAFVAHGLFEFHLASDDYGAATAQGRRLVELEPEEPSHRYKYATSLLRSGEPDALHAAIWVLKSLCAQSTQSIWTRCLLAEALIKGGLQTEACRLIGCLPSADRRPTVEILRAWICSQQGRDAEAKARWQGLLQRKYTPALHSNVNRLVRIDRNPIDIHSSDVLLITVMRNEAPRLQWFFDYYQRLGVDHFLIVDNASTDETTNLLLQRSNVILYQTSDSYSRAGAGVRWVNYLIDQHGAANWCVHVDADEAFVLRPGHDNLRSLVATLAAEDSEALLAPLLDMYPAEMPAEHGRAQVPLDQRQSLYQYYDADLLTYGHPICPYAEVHGGVRRRLFKGYQLLNKVPLINAAAGVRFLLSTHQTTPARMANFAGALLHYHLFYLLEPQYRERLHDAIRRREFPSNALERTRSRDLLANIPPGSSLLAKQSRRFTSSSDVGHMDLIGSETETVLGGIR